MTESGINYVCPVPSDLLLPPVVYKYRAINEILFKSLLLNQVWLAKPDSFNDPFEPERIFSDTRFSVELMRSVRDAGMLCLCKKADNLPMWTYYGAGLHGIAVGYDYELLLKSMQPANPRTEDYSPIWKYVFEVDYRGDGLSQVDEMALLRNDALTETERQKMFATKSQEFAHEEELRVVVQPSPDSDPQYSWVGHGLYSHAPAAIKEIVFGELITDQDRHAVINATAGRQIEYFDAIRDKSTFGIRITRVHS